MTTFNNSSNTWRYSSNARFIFVHTVSVAFVLRCTLIFTLIATFVFGTASAQTISYTDGENNSSSITTGNPTILTISSGSAIQSGVISGSGSLEKDGSGTITLTNADSYAGTTTVDLGTLSISGGGSLVNGSTYTINSGSVLEVTDGSAALGGDTPSGSAVYGEVLVGNGGTFNEQDTTGVYAQGGTFALQGGLLTGTFESGYGLIQTADANTLIEGYGTLSAETVLMVA